jgi:PAS domain S-box-containing protein
MDSDQSLTSHALPFRLLDSCKRVGVRQRVLIAAGVYALVGGAVTLLGWAIGSQLLTDWAHTGISMFPNTAVCACLCGAALLVLSTNATNQQSRSTVRILALFVALVGGLTLFQHLSGLNLGIDTLLFDRPWGQRAAAAPMRMGPPASTSFLLLGAGLLLATCTPAARRLASALGTLPIAISALSLIGYWFGADQLYTLVHLTAIAVQTSSIIAVLGIGLMAAVPEQGIVSLLCRDDAGGMLFRRLLLPIIAIPLLLGWLRLVGEQAGLYDGGFGLSVLLLTMIIMLLALLAVTASSISRAAQATKKSRNQLEAVLQQAPVAIGVLDASGNLTMANDLMRHYAPNVRPAQEQEQSGRWQAVDAQAQAVSPLDWVCATVLRGNQAEDTNFFYTTKDGRELVVRAGATALQDETGNVVGAITTVVDVTDRMQVEQVLREREQRYELVLVGAEAAIWDWDVPQKRVLYSPRWKQLRGLADHEVGDSEEEWSKRIHAEDRDRVLAAVKAHFQRCTPVFAEEYRAQHKDGHWVWVLNRGIARWDAAGQVVRMAGSETDITERKRAEEELRNAEERMRSVVDHVVDGIVTIDEYGNVESFNPAAEKLFGYRQGELIGQNVKLLMPEPYHSQHDGYLRNYLTTGQAKIIGIGREVVGQRKDGSTFPMELAVSEFQIGQRRFFTGIVRNITERKQLEDQLRRQVEELADSDRRKNEFLATLAHELRNPLAPIRNSLNILRLTTPGDLGTSRVQEMMERQVNHMVRLVDDLLEVGRITSGKIELRKERVEIAAVLRSALETSKPLIETSGHQLGVSLPTEPLSVEADPVRLSQVVANLLNNAAKYTEPGGEIWLAAVRENGHVSISVRDTGVGISAAMLPQLFRMFAQADKDHKRSQGGLGIGLALAKSLIEMHGGEIDAHSGGEGCGSEFVIRLPLSEEQLPVIEAPMSEPVESNASTRSRVLVVDDNRDAAASLAVLLKMLGNEVATADDGPAALEAIQSFRPSVVLLDLGMPGMSGFEVVERARTTAAGRQSVLVALTGWGQEDDRRRTREAGFQHHLVKPVDIAALQKLLAEVQAQKAGTPLTTT